MAVIKNVFNVIRTLINWVAERLKYGKQSLAAPEVRGGEKMLLDSFVRQTELVRTVQIIDPESLGRTLSESFVVGIRRSLATPPSRPVVLSQVGTLLWDEKEGVRFDPDEFLTRDIPEHTLRLRNFLREDDFFSQEIIDARPCWSGATLNEVFRKASTPFLGQQFLMCVGALLIQSRMRNDPFLKQTFERLDKDPTFEKQWLELFENALCLALHDTICCGAGIHLETIGTFRSDATFVPDELLITSIKARISKSGWDSKHSAFEFYRVDE